tara:strand:+ start:101 stop:1501 length:1401 start_codon:yes stop_codon:yes gene_type:complete
MNIELDITNTSTGKSVINSETNVNKLYCKIENDNENTINLYANTNYNFIVNDSTNTTEKYYIGFFYNFNYYIDNTTNPLSEYIIGINNIGISSTNIINTSYKFKLIDINYNFTWSIFEINTTKNNNNKFYYNQILSGKLKINNPLVYINLKFENNKLLNITDNTDTLININYNQNIISNKLDITLYENTNYIFKLTHNSNILFNIYYNTIELYNKLTNLETIKSTTYTTLFIKNLSNTNKKKYKWSFSDSSYNGDLYFINLKKYKSNDEKLYDYKFKNIEINFRLFYNTFIYNEHLNIKNLNNNINNLTLNDSHKLLLINNNNKNISIILPSNNIYIGLTYNILLNQDLNLLNIYCEDNTETLDNYDKLKGALLITNNNNLYCKCVSSLTEKLDTNNINTNLSENVILKKIKLNNSNVYNGGLYKYGFIKIICSEYLNNKYIWNVEGNLIGNSILYSNTYLYNPFI